MSSGKSLSAEDLQSISRFDSLRKILLSDGYADHLDKPLAYWALPTDRRLPLAFLSRSLRDLLDVPFAELTRTPGIGRKKIHSFVRLLARAANTDRAELPNDIAVAVAKRHNGQSKEHSGGGNGNGNGFDAGSVSEILWSQWRSSVVRHGLEGEMIGQFAPSLAEVTRVIWNMPLSEYTNVTLREIRAMKTHGEKRVRAILDVFHSVHTLVAQMGVQEHLVVRIVPRNIDRVERWIGHVLQMPGLPTEKEVFENFTEPLLQQVRTDATEQIADLAENRLGLGGPITSVRQAARTKGLTRARVYQLLNEINDIISVRWPDGRHQVYELREKIQTESAQMANPPEWKQFFSAIELFYPGTRRGAAGPLEQSPEEMSHHNMRLAIGAV